MPLDAQESASEAIEDGNKPCPAVWLMIAKLVQEDPVLYAPMYNQMPDPSVDGDGAHMADQQAGEQSVGDEVSGGLRRPSEDGGGLDGETSAARVRRRRASTKQWKLVAEGDRKCRASSLPWLPHR